MDRLSAEQRVFLILMMLSEQDEYEKKEPLWMIAWETAKRLAFGETKRERNNTALWRFVKNLNITEDDNVRTILEKTYELSVASKNRASVPIEEWAKGGYGVGRFADALKATGFYVPPPDEDEEFEDAQGPPEEPKAAPSQPEQPAPLGTPRKKNEKKPAMTATSTPPGRSNRIPVGGTPKKRSKP